MPFRYQLRLLYTTQPKPLRSWVAYAWPPAIQLLLLITRKRIMPVTVLREIQVRVSYLSFSWSFSPATEHFRSACFFLSYLFRQKCTPKTFFIKWALPPHCLTSTAQPLPLYAFFLLPNLRLINSQLPTHNSHPLAHPLRTCR